MVKMRLSMFVLSNSEQRILTFLNQFFYSLLVITNILDLRLKHKDYFENKIFRNLF